MNAIATPAFRPESNREIVAADVRAELGKRRIRVSHLPGMLGNSREYWRRRVTKASTALDIDDLSILAELLDVEVSHLTRNARRAPQPQGPEGSSNAQDNSSRLWESNPRPIHYKVTDLTLERDRRVQRTAGARVGVAPVTALRPRRAI